MFRVLPTILRAPNHHKIVKCVGIPCPLEQGARAGPWWRCPSASRCCCSWTCCTSSSSRCCSRPRAASPATPSVRGWGFLGASALLVSVLPAVRAMSIERTTVHVFSLARRPQLHVDVIECGRRSVERSHQSGAWSEQRSTENPLSQPPRRGGRKGEEGQESEGAVVLTVRRAAQAETRGPAEQVASSPWTWTGWAASDSPRTPRRSRAGPLCRASRRLLRLSMRRVWCVCTAFQVY